MHRERDLAARRAMSHKKRCHRTWSKTLESLANPLESLRVRLQAASRSVAERASELGVLLVDYSKLGFAHDNQHQRSSQLPHNRIGCYDLHGINMENCFNSGVVEHIINSLY